MNHIIKKRQLKAHHATSTRGGEAHNELLKDGDVVRAIEVRCSCGSSTVVELHYAEPQNPASDIR